MLWQLFLAIALAALVPLIVFIKVRCREGASVPECSCRKGWMALVTASALAFGICALGAYVLAAEQGLVFMEELLRFWKVWTLALGFALLLRIGELLAKNRPPLLRKLLRLLYKEN